MIPLAAGEAQGGKTLLVLGFVGHVRNRFACLDPPGCGHILRMGLRREGSGVLCHGAFDDDA
jgi:hypothetical protein